MSDIVENQAGLDARAERKVCFIYPETTERIIRRARAEALRDAARIMCPRCHNGHPMDQHINIRRHEHKLDWDDECKSWPIRSHAQREGIDTSSW